MSMTGVFLAISMQSCVFKASMIVTSGSEQYYKERNTLILRCPHVSRLALNRRFSAVAGTADLPVDIVRVPDVVQPATVDRQPDLREDILGQLSKMFDLLTLAVTASSFVQKAWTICYVYACTRVVPSVWCPVAL